MEELICKVQNYEWGKKGDQSLVYDLKKYHDNSIDSEKKYSELWMGTHPNGCSILKSSKKHLSDYIKNLPFLFKVLSIEKPLSIQAHPNKKLASILFKKYPDIYKDPNHKPEMVVAISTFEALCGFKNLEQILFSMLLSPELIDLLKINPFEIISNSYQFYNNNNGHKIIKELFETLVNSPNEIVESQTQKYIDRIKKKEKKYFIESLSLRINNYFPNDVGIFCLFFLNYIKLSPGESLYLEPGVPHAYIYGDCIECMANSDNVIRVGLTPKYKDVQTLCSMLNYQHYPIKTITKNYINNHTWLYDSGVEDFVLYYIEIPVNQKYKLSSLPENNHSILLITSGEGHLLNNVTSFNISKGSTIFIYDNSNVFIENYCDIMKCFLCTHRSMI